MRLIYMTGTAANQDRTESPLSINHYSTLSCLSVQCSDTSSDLQPKERNEVTLKELLHPLTKASHLQTLRDLKRWFKGFMMSVVKILCCLLLIYHLNEAKKIKRNREGEWCCVYMTPHESLPQLISGALACRCSSQSIVCIKMLKFSY